MKVLRIGTVPVLVKVDYPATKLNQILIVSLKYSPLSSFGKKTKKQKQKQKPRCSERSEKRMVALAKPRKTEGPRRSFRGAGGQGEEGFKRCVHPGEHRNTRSHAIFIRETTFQRNKI